MSAPHRARFSLIELDTETHLASLADEVRAGLMSTPKRIPCRFFYDEAGSLIFEEICELPEYYLTRAESQILRHRAETIARHFDEPIALVELGSGNSTKTRILIEALLEHHGALSYVPIDISANMLENTALQLLDDYKQLEIRAIAAEYQDGLRQLRANVPETKLIVLLGSSIGNLDHSGAARFISELRRNMNRKDHLLLGIDLRKHRDLLESAYDDASGVTARFNRNLLERINRELGGQFDPQTFDFRARYDERSGAVDSHLVSREEQVIGVDALDLQVHFRAGETIHTESSYKYSLAEIDALARSADLERIEHWLDAENRFSLNLFSAGSGFRVETGG